MHFLQVTYNIFLLAIPAIARDFHYLGCFSDLYDLEDVSASPFMAIGLCKTRCERRGDAIMALRNSTDCYCGNTFPSWEDELDPTECNLRCPGFPQNICGGRAAMSCYEIDQVTETTYEATVEPTVWPTMVVADPVC